MTTTAAVSACLLLAALQGCADRPAGPPSPLFRVGGAVMRPELVCAPPPVNPEAASRARREGEVVIDSIIDEKGGITLGRILKPMPLGLDAAARAAVRQWKFKPATLYGKPVRVSYPLLVLFKLPAAKDQASTPSRAAATARRRSSVQSRE
jgi:TonB family protein